MSLIQLESITKTFKAKPVNIEALRGVSIQVEAGQIYGIVGYSGAGKSTLIRIINQLETQSSGAVILNGVNLSSLSKPQLRKKRQKIGMIFQHFNLLWSRTIAKNIELPMEIAGVAREIRKKKVRELIDLVGLSGREKDYPSTLSGGQKQRVGIARALANQPDILLCDEATSALDPKTTVSILELLQKINQELGLTIILITHQMEVIQKICHRVAIMSDGQIVEEGEVSEVFSTPKHSITKGFVAGVMGVEVEEELKERLLSLYPDAHLLKLNFAGAITDEPILANVIQKSKAKASIIHASITHVSGKPIGFLIVAIDKKHASGQKEFVSLLKKEGVKVEVIS